MYHTSSQPRTQFGSRGRPGFTLIEMLVVLAIIAILATISLVVANRVSEGGKDRLTSDLIKTLDTAAQSFISQAGKIPATYIDGRGNEFALIDARGDRRPLVGNRTDATELPEPSLALFILAASKYTSVDDAIKGIDNKYIARGPVQSPALGTQVLKTDGAPVDAVIVKDAWGNAIRFVHPAFHGGYGTAFKRDNTGQYLSVSGRDSSSEIKRVLKSQAGGTVTAQFRRSARPFQTGNGVGDADEGLCAGAMPYFYSAGPDKDAGTRTDNVYSTRPTYPAETKDQP